jgi:zinc/manganese transport system permease protein
VELSILLPAFAAGIVVLLSHVPLGKEVLKRGIIFIDLAIAQFAGLGIIVAHYFGFHSHGLEIQFFALLGALLGAAFLSITERYLHDHQEAGIGILFVLAATASLLLIANNPHGGEQLNNILVGQILWAEWAQLIPALLVGVFVLMVYFKANTLFKSKWFYLLFALAITQSVQLVGVYLVFATLIIPALASIKIGKKNHFFMPFILGVSSYAIGLIISSFVDLPSGAVIVWVMAVLSLLLVSILNTRQ